MSIPSVSIILPMYNASAHVSHTIESVLAQTFRDFELIAVDDGSSDDCASVAERYAVRVIRQQNLGPSGARNTGIGATNPDSKYIALIDHDDIWLPEKLDRQIDLMERRAEVGMCHTNGRFMYPGDAARNYVPHRFPEPDVSAIRHILPNNKVFAPSAVLRRSVLDRVGLFHQPFTIVQDWDLWFRMAPHTEFAFLPEVLIEYTVHGNNLSMSGKPFWEQRIELLESRVPIVLDGLLRTAGRGWQRFVRTSLRRQLALSYSGLAKHLAAEGRRSEARRLHLRAICTAPEIARLHSRLLRSLLTAPTGVSAQA